VNGYKPPESSVVASKMTLVDRRTGWKREQADVRRSDGEKAALKGVCHIDTERDQEKDE
jgi:hypothetical protein